MIKNQYALYDKTAKAYLNPIHFINHGEAVRWLTTVVNNQEEKTNINLYPQQFVLTCLGTYDDQMGTFENKQEEIMQASSVQETKQRFTIDQLMETLDKRYSEVNPLTTNTQAI